MPVLHGFNYNFFREAEISRDVITINSVQEPSDFYELMFALVIAKGMLNSNDNILLDLSDSDSSVFTSANYNTTKTSTGSEFFSVYDIDWS